MLSEIVSHSNDDNHKLLYSIITRSHSLCRIQLSWVYRVREIFLVQYSVIHRKVNNLTPAFSLSVAISWSAVPEHPLDVTANGFPQGTTKKGIGSLQARYSMWGRGDSGCELTPPLSNSRTCSSPQKENLTH